MFSSTKLAVNYSLFALIATTANIGFQHIVNRLYAGSLAIFISVVVGTGAGLVVKYLLDKRYIFQFRTRGLVHDTQTFALYTTMGIVTTVIFWVFEFGFEYLWHSTAMRYLGGVIGLAIGYLTKYHLDKRYVFRSEVI